MVVNVNFPKGKCHTMKYLSGIVKFFLLNKDWAFTLTPPRNRVMFYHEPSSSCSGNTALLLTRIQYHITAYYQYTLFRVYFLAWVLITFYQKSIYYVLLKVSLFYCERGSMTLWGNTWQLGYTDLLLFVWMCLTVCMKFICSWVIKKEIIIYFMNPEVFDITYIKI